MSEKLKIYEVPEKIRQIIDSYSEDYSTEPLAVEALVEEFEVMLKVLRFKENTLQTLWDFCDTTSTPK